MCTLCVDAVDTARAFVGIVEALRGVVVRQGDLGTEQAAFDQVGPRAQAVHLHLVDVEIVIRSEDNEHEPDEQKFHCQKS